MAGMSKCQCLSGKSFEDCCAPYLTGGRAAPTAEALMRSRYVAYVRGDIDYIEATSAPEALRDFDRAGSEAWAKKSEWLGLEIIAVQGGGANDTSGQVEFVARFKSDGVEHRHHELSEFRREDGKWFFVDGKLVRQPVQNEGPRIGRNDPCTCGSGKKYKKCCGAAA